MPHAVLKKYAEEANVSLAEAEKKWEQAKGKADKIFKDKPKDGEYWAMVNIYVKMFLGLEYKTKDKKK